MVVATTRRARPALTLAGGAAAGLGVPLAPFAVLAPGGLARGVLVGQLVRNASGGRDLTGRLAELAGAEGLLSLPARFPRPLLLAAIGAVLAGLYAAAYLAAGRRPAALDAYALLGAVAVTGMLLWPRLYYSHYGAFDGPFLALAVALPAGLLSDALPAAGGPAVSRPAAWRSAGRVQPPALCWPPSSPPRSRRQASPSSAPSPGWPGRRSRRPRTGSSRRAPAW